MNSNASLSGSSSASWSDLTDDTLLGICEQASVIACKCPAYLVTLLRSIREFRSYTTDCIQQFPEDAETHDWLNRQVAQAELIVARTVIELLQREQLLDEQQQIDLQMLGERNRSTIVDLA